MDSTQLRSAFHFHLVKSAIATISLRLQIHVSRFVAPFRSDNNTAYSSCVFACHCVSAMSTSASLHRSWRRGVTGYSSVSSMRLLCGLNAIVVYEDQRNLLDSIPIAKESNDAVWRRRWGAWWGPRFFNPPLIIEDEPGEGSSLLKKHRDGSQCISGYWNK